MEVSVVCSNCNYRSRVSTATLASNMYYCQNCGKQIEGALPPRPAVEEEGQAARKGGARRPANRRPGGNRPAPRRR